MSDLKCGASIGERTPLTDDDLVNITGGASPQAGPAGNIGQTHTFSRGDAWQKGGFVYVSTCAQSVLDGNEVSLEKFRIDDPIKAGSGIQYNINVNDLLNTDLFEPISKYTTY